MPSINSLTKPILPLYTSQNLIESTLPTPQSSSCKTGFLKKAAICTSAMICGATVAYYVRSYFSMSGAEDGGGILSQASDQSGKGFAHARIQPRVVATTTPFENQQANPGSLYQSVGHTFFTEPGNVLIQHTIKQGPSWLRILSDPLNVSVYDTPGQATGIQVVGDTAFVADGSSGLQIINISNPKAPTLIGSYDTPGNAYKLQVVGDTAFVADQAGGLQIIDISDPSIPILISAYKAPAQVLGVQVIGNTAFVSAWSAGLQIINITDLSAPLLIGSYDTSPGFAYGVQVVGNFAFIANNQVDHRIISIANPKSPTFVGSYTDTSSVAIQVVGNNAFVADGANGLKIITGVANPFLLGSYDTPGVARETYVVGNIAYVADDVSGLQLLNTSNLRNPTLFGSYDTSGKAYGVQVVENIAFVADFDSGLQLLSLNQIKFSGTPSSTDQGDFVVKVSGTTPSGAASSTFNLRVGQPPNPILPVPLVLVDVNQNLAYTFEAGTFADQNDQNRLVYSVTRQDGSVIPAWLTFNPSTRVLSGRPGVADLTTLDCYYLATDGYFLPSRIPFQLKVEGPPVLTTPLPDVTNVRNTLLNLNLDQNAFTDPNGDSLTYSARLNGTYALPKWLSFSGTGFFSGTPIALEKLNITVFANDGFGGIVSDSFSMVVTDPIPAMTAVAGGSVVFQQIPETAFEDMGTITEYTGGLAGGGPLPIWIQFDEKTQTFTAKPPLGRASTLLLQVGAKTTLGEVFNQIFPLNIVTNLPPTYRNPISDQAATVDVNFNYIMPDNAFFDPNGDPLTYSATTFGGSSLPKWLSFNADLRTFSGKPTPADTNTYAVRTLTIAVTANDGQTTTTGTFDILVGGESYLAKIINITAPIISGLTTMFGFYKKRALILNRINKKKYIKENVILSVGEKLNYKLFCNAAKVKAITASKFSKRRWERIPDDMSYWLEYNSATGVVYSKSGAFLENSWPVRIRGIGSAGVILEQFDLSVVDHVRSSAFQGDFSHSNTQQSLIVPSRGYEDSEHYPSSTKVHRYSKRWSGNHKADQSLEESVSEGETMMQLYSMDEQSHGFQTETMNETTAALSV